MEQKQNITPNKPSALSPFCETLMDVTLPVAGMRQPSDCAIVICSDGKTVAARQCGLYPQVLSMIFCKMLNDDKFAELLTEASMLYARHTLGKNIHTSFKEDTPFQKETN